MKSPSDSTIPFLACAAMVALVACEGRPAAERATLIVHNAQVYTVHDAQPRAEAIAVRGDRIVLVGTSREALALGGPQTRVIDAGGATLVPGLQDAHGHFTNLGASLQVLQLRGTTSYEQIVEMVRARAATARPGEWIQGRSWDQNDWENKEWPSHQRLTEAAPNNPVYLTRVDGHAALVNKAALEAAAATRATPDPAGGRIIRDANGEPAGVLIDSAQALVSSKIPAVTDAQLEEQILLADAQMRMLGLTMIHDAGATPATVAAYKRLIDAGRLKTRLYVMLRGPLSMLEPEFRKGPVINYGGYRLSVRAIKIGADGALGSRGAALLEPYSDEPGTSGFMTTPPEEIYAQTLAASRAGFQTCVHAIGDRGNRVTLDVFERVQAEVPGARDLRMRNEHAQIVDAAEIPRFAKLNVIASMQATHATSDMPWVPARIGQARAQEGAYVWQRLLKSGVTLANGSDFPVEEPNPMLGFYAAVTRQDPTGRPEGGWMPEERLSREEMLKSFTWGAAYAAHAEKDLGSLKVGKLADMVLLDKNVMAIEPRELLSTQTTLTIIGGEVVHEKTMTRVLFVCLVALVSLVGRPMGRPYTEATRAAGATPASPDQPATPPKLLIIIVIDQMRFDYFDRYGKSWSGGLARFAKEGAVFERGFYPYLNTVTCAGHATIATGTFPYEHGIIMNEWYQRGPERRMSCTDDPAVKSLPYTPPAEPIGHSARRLRVPTLGDRLRATSPASRVVTLSMKPRSTVMLAGQRGTAVTWFGDSNVWATSTAFTPALLPEVQSFVDANPVERYRAEVWDRLRPSSEYIGDDDSPHERARAGWTSPFPHPLAGSPGTAPARFFDSWERSPFSDAYLGRMAAHLVRTYQLGQRDAVDYLGISFSGLDYVGHDFGPESHEVQDALVRLDGTLGEFFAVLDSTVGRDRYAIGLSADHGVARIPEAVRAEGGDAGRVVNPEVLKLAEAAMTAAHGAGPHVALVEYTNLYLTKAARTQAEKDLSYVQPIIDAVSRMPGIQRVFSSRGLENKRASTDPIERAAALGHHPEESGDVTVILKPNWIGTNTSTTTHGSAQPYDQHVPVVFLGAPFKPGRYATPASPADLAPTLASLVKLTMPEADGRVLTDGLKH